MVISSNSKAGEAAHGKAQTESSQSGFAVVHIDVLGDFSQKMAQVTDLQRVMFIIVYSADPISNFVGFSNCTP